MNRQKITGLYPSSSSSFVVCSISWQLLVVGAFELPGAGGEPLQPPPVRRVPVRTCRRPRRASRRRTRRSPRRAGPGRRTGRAGRPRSRPRRPGCPPAWSASRRPPAATRPAPAAAPAPTSTAPAAGACRPRGRGPSRGRTPRTSSNSSLYAGDSAYLRSWVSRSSGNGVDSSRYFRMSRAPPLHEVPRQQLAARDRLQVHVRQARLEQAEEVAEAVLLAAVRGGGDQDQVPVLVRGEARDELVPQHPRPAAGAVGHAGVRLVDDQQVRAAVPELLAQPGALDEVGGDHDVRVPVEQRLAEQQAPSPAAGSSTAAPAPRECRTWTAAPAATARPAPGRTAPPARRVALLQQLRGDQARLDGLADAHVVGDQHPHGVLPQRHQQRHELVGARLHGEPGQRAERPGAGPEPDPQRGPQQARAGGRSRRRPGRAPRRSPGRPAPASGTRRRPRRPRRPAAAARGSPGPSTAAARPIPGRGR